MSEEEEKTQETTQETQEMGETTREATSETDETETENAAASPVVEETVEYIEDVESGSEKDKEILDIIRTSCLEPHFKSSWKPIKVQNINNKTAESEYEEKKQDFLIRGRKDHEIEEKFGFAVENNVASLELIASIGLQSKDSEYNALGYNRMGVYLCKNGDICLQHALVKHSGSHVMRMVIYKYIPGKHTTAIPRVASAAEFIEPTQGFDSHVSVISPSTNDSLQNQYDRSQIYLYEINKLLQPVSHPRQVLPYAIVSFTLDGAYHPAVDAEPTADDKLAGNPRLQHIINSINSKNEKPGAGNSSSGSPGCTPSPPIGQPSPQAATVPIGLPVASPGVPTVGPGPGPTIPGPTAGSILGAPAMLGQGVLGLGNGVPLLPQTHSHTPSPELDAHPGLAHIISQINARLEAEERGKKIMGRGGMGNGMPPKGGPGIVPGPAAPTNGALPLNGALPPGGLMGNMNMNMGGVAGMPPGPRHALNILTNPAASMGNGLLTTQNPALFSQTSGMLSTPPGMGIYPGVQHLPKMAPMSALPTSGYLGSLARSSPLGSRPLTPDVPVSSHMGHMFAGGSGMVFSTAGAPAMAQQPYMSTGLFGAGNSGLLGTAHAGLLGTGGSGLGLQAYNPAAGLQAFTPGLPKEMPLKYQYEYAPGALNFGLNAGAVPAATLNMGAQGAGATMLAYPFQGNTALQMPASATPGYVLNQPMKRPLTDGYRIDEKRIKYY